MEFIEMRCYKRQLDIKYIIFPRSLSTAFIAQYTPCSFFYRMAHIDSEVARKTSFSKPSYK